MAGQPRSREREGLDPHPRRDDPRHKAWGERTHPPFDPGNLVPVKSGAWSSRLIAETVEELRPDLQFIVDQAEWITPLDAHALEDYLYDRARLIRLERWLAENGDRYTEGNE